jgi:hypothetical protein
MIYFHSQEPQSGSHSVDLSVIPKEPIIIEGKRYTYNTPFLLIEAKRLPTPPKKGRHEYEYVTGLNKQRGGIQRFKLGVHGAEHNCVVIVGYVQKNSCAEWYKTINAWITDLVSGKLKDDCTWCDGEQLKCFSEDVQRGVARCESLHPRCNQAQDLLIYHIWISMTPVRPANLLPVARMGKSVPYNLDSIACSLVVVNGFRKDF